ncbi:MAG: trypsin-like peptidase domain-containing protein [Clostridia bacterium]|nr:trypsin-like peptidase domain-containing protein [Clostridia bacterium]
MYNNHRYSYEVRSRVPRVQTVRRMSPLAVVFLVIFILGACIGSGFLGAKLVSNSSDKKAASPQTTIIYRDAQDRGENLSSNGEAKTSTEVAAMAKQSVVEIFTETATYASRDTALVSSGAGSGVIIATDGYILTAYHVIEDAEQIKVRLSDGSTFNAEWIRGDKLSDLAVVKINAQTLNSATIGDSTKLQAGEEIVAIGNPLGSLGGTVTCGNVSALNRAVTIGGKEMSGMVQLSCSLNPGDSGGGIFNVYGALVGIVNARGVGEYGVNIGFASPISDAIKIATDLIRNGYVTGRVDTAVFDVREISNSQTTPAGLYFMGVNNEDVHTTLVRNDYIVSVAGVEVATKSEWEDVLNSKSVGDTVEIVYRRQGVEGTVRLVLINRTDCD